MKDGNPGLRVTWTALQNVANLLHYRVDYRRNGELNWGNRVNLQPSSSTLLPALLPGTKYNVRMRAVSAAGEEVIPSDYCHLSLMPHLVPI